MRVAICLAGFGVLLAFGSSGCARFDYTGVSLSARTFHDDPGISDYYVGADAQFVVTDREQENRRADASVDFGARHAAVDPASPPIHWDRIVAEADAPPVEQAATDARVETETWPDDDADASGCADQR
jgi:hypothetical protein